MVEKPEFDSTLEQSLAPGIIASFKGIPQTAWMPPDCTIAVNPENVMLGVNTTMAIYSKSGNLKSYMDF